jgi:hypothetical protein
MKYADNVLIQGYTKIEIDTAGNCGNPSAVMHMNTGHRTRDWMSTAVG